MVRLTEAQYSALERIAKETGQDPAKLIRLAVDALLKHIEKCGGKLVLPLDFNEVVQVLRTQAASQKEEAGAEKAHAA